MIPSCFEKGHSLAILVDILDKLYKITEYENTYPEEHKLITKDYVEEIEQHLIKNILNQAKANELVSHPKLYRIIQYFLKHNQEQANAWVEEILIRTQSILDFFIGHYFFDIGVHKRSLYPFDSRLSETIQHKLYIKATEIHQEWKTSKIDLDKYQQDAIETIVERYQDDFSDSNSDEQTEE